MLKNTSLLPKLVLFIGAISMNMTTIILASTLGASSYEISVINAYPTLLWILILLTVICGFFAVTYCIFVKQIPSLCFGGLFLVFTCNLIILSLPIIRGYAFYGRTDAITHLGYTMDILSSGHISATNFYPIFHILASIISNITNLSPEVIIISFPSLFYLLFLCGIYLLATKITSNFNHTLLIVIFGLPLLNTIYSSQFYIGALSFMIFPILLALRIQENPRRSIQNTIILIILLYLVPFIHPFTSVYLFVTFVLFEVVLFMFKRILGFKESSLKISLTPALILFSTFFLWFSSFVIFRNAVKELADLLFGEVSEQYLYTYQTALSKANFSVYDSIELLIKLYGHQLIYLTLSFLAILYIINKVILYRDQVSIVEIFMASLFIISFVLFITLLFGHTVSTNPFRESVIMLQSSMILNGLVLYEWIFNQRRKKSNFPKNTAVYLVALVLIISAGIGIFNVHSSPFVKAANPQCTYCEFAGGEWLYQKGNTLTKDTYNYETIFVLSSQLGWRLAYSTLGYEVGHKVRFDSPPPHFESQSENWFGSNENDIFLVLTDYDKKYYSDLWPSEGSFNSLDFKNLDNLPLSTIYSNDGFKVYIYEGDK